ARMEQARGFLKFLLESQSRSQGWAGMLREELQSMLDRPDDGLYHDDLAEINDAFYFRDFIEHARAPQLQYVGEAETQVMFDTGNSLGWLKAGRIEREQYLDFIRLRRFRQTLLCHEGVALAPEISARNLEGLWFSADIRVLEDGRIKGPAGECTSESE